MTDSYHFQIEPEPRAEVAWFDGYFLSAEASQLYFPSGAALQVSGDKIVGRIDALVDTVTEWEAAQRTGPRLMTHAELIQTVLDAFKGAVPQRAPLPNSDEWRGIGHKAHDTFGADFIVTKGAEPTRPLHTSPTTDSAYPAIAGLLRG